MPAKIIAFEGLDCSFKETNSRTLYKHLKLIGEEVYLFSFPSYGEKSSYFVEQFLKGSYDVEHNRDDFNPYTISLFYAMDRFDKWQKVIKPIYETREDAIIILDRWVLSNIMFQVARPASMTSVGIPIVDFIPMIENSVLRLPKEDLTIYMDIPFDLSREIIAKRHADKNDGTKLDVNEANEAYMKNVYSISSKTITLAKRYGANKPFVTIDCAKALDSGEIVLKSKQEIFDSVSEAVAKYIL